MLTLKNITYRIAGRMLLDEANLTVNEGYHLGLVGPNGTGKSTLFNLIDGEIELDSGEIEMPPKMTLGRVRQDLPDDDTTLLDIVLSADTERASLLEEVETETDTQRICDIYERLAEINAYEAPVNASIILSGLGFDIEAQARPISSFSGGWRMRVALAAALFMAPDLLLLDEPTNHLDFEAIIWLENYLQSYPKTYIIISHDREVLNKVCTHIAHLDQLKLEVYKGNYDEFETRKAQKDYNQQALHEKQQAQKKKAMDFVSKFGAKASKASQAQSRLKMIEKMDFVGAIMAERATAFNFPQPEPLGSPIISVKNVEVGYAVGEPVLSNLDFRIDQEDRIGLLGANGNGKSTLIKLLSGKLKELSGKYDPDTKLRIGYFAQHQSDEMDTNLTPYETMRDFIPGVDEHNIRAMIGKFGFNKDKADTKIKELSGGEKARLLFCMMSYDAPHIMLLDEPTNHLDMDARGALTQALNNYEGCVILVSHDPHLVEAVVDQLWLVADGTAKRFDGDLEEYKKLVIEQRKSERSATKKDTKDKKNNKSKGKNNNIDKILQKAERDLERLSKRVQEIENDMTSEKALMNSGFMNDLLAQYKIAKKEFEDSENTWLELSEKNA